MKYLLTAIVLLLLCSWDFPQTELTGLDFEFKGPLNRVQIFEGIKLIKELEFDDLSRPVRITDYSGGLSTTAFIEYKENSIEIFGPQGETVIQRFNGGWATIDNFDQYIYYFEPLVQRWKIIRFTNGQIVNTKIIYFDQGFISRTYSYGQDNYTNISLPKDELDAYFNPTKTTTGETIRYIYDPSLFQAQNVLK